MKKIEVMRKKGMVRRRRDMGKTARNMKEIMKKRWEIIMRVKEKKLKEKNGGKEVLTCLCLPPMKMQKCGGRR